MPTEGTAAAETAPRRPSAKAKKNGATPKKPAAARTRKASADGSSPRITPPTDEEIRLRAYFISERRHRLDLPGDASSDWLEATRQLLSEAGPQ